MFELVKGIPVTFGPHWIDVTQAVLTLASLLATAFLGFLAYKNGKLASEMAKQSVEIARSAAERELAHSQQLLEIQNMQLENDSATRRRRFAAKLQPYVAKIVQFGDTDLLFPEELSMLLAEVTDPNAKEMSDYVQLRASTFVPGHEGFLEATRTTQAIMSIIHNWTVDPSSFTGSVRTATQDQISFVKQIRNVESAWDISDDLEDSSK